MKNFKFTTLIALIATLAFSVTMTSCGDDEKSNPETNTGGNTSYSGYESLSSTKAWGIVNSQYATMIDSGENIETVRCNKTIGNKTEQYDSIFFTSPTWGTGKFDLDTKTGTMRGPHRNPQTFEKMGDELYNYDATISKEKNGKAYVINIPALMYGGTTITSYIGAMHEDFTETKTYTINTYVDNARNYFPAKSYPSADETLVIAPKPTFVISYTSQSTPSWGTYEFTKLSVDAEKGSYKITGEGKAQIASPRDGSIGTYDTTIDATVKDGNITGEINIPGVMGGIIIHINPADFDDVINQ